MLVNFEALGVIGVGTPMSPAPRRRTPSLPTVVLPSGRVDVPVSVAKPTGVGTLAHLVIALLAPTTDSCSPARLTDSCLALAHELAAPSPRARANSVLAAGFAAEYLRTLRPQAPWDLLGVEYDTGAGQADLAYQNTRTGAVFFDEVKTTHVPYSQPSPDWVDQALRYAVAGAERFGGRFKGTRLLPLGSRHLTVLVSATGRATPLAPTLTAPFSRERA